MKKFVFIFTLAISGITVCAEPVDRVMINSIEIKMKLIPLSKVAPDLPDYYLSATEVTYSEYQYVKSYAERNLNYRFFSGEWSGTVSKKRMLNPLSTEQEQNQPVTNISWYDCVLWCNALSEMAGLMPYYIIDKTILQKHDFLSSYDNTTDVIVTGVNKGADGYRLPNYREWVYVALGNKNDSTLSNKFFGIGSEEEFSLYANYNNKDWSVSSSADTTMEVASKRSNSFGIYDLAGNALEWLDEQYLIGGYFSSNYEECLGYRHAYPSEILGFLGFRLAKNPN